MCEKKRLRGKPALSEIDSIIQLQGWSIRKRGLILLKPTVMDKGIRYSFQNKAELLEFLINEKKLAGLDDLLVRELRVK